MGTVVGFCKHCNENLESIKCGNFLTRWRVLIFSEELRTVQFVSYVEQMCAHLRVDFDIKKRDIVSECCQPLKQII